MSQENVEYNADWVSQAKIAVVCGGVSAEREVSLHSGQAIHKALESSGVNSTLVDYPTVSIEAIKEQGFDCVFIALHGRGGEDGVLQGALEVQGIPYTGSGVLGSALAMDKYRSKLVWRSLKLPVSAGVLLSPESVESQAARRALFVKLGPAIAVKPVHEGSSVGITKVTNEEQLVSAYNEAASRDTSVLAEQWINGDEYTVSIVGRTALPSIRLHTPNEFYDYEAKYESGTTRYFCPSGLESEQEQLVQSLALKAFDALGCKGWGRVDLIRDDEGRFYLLEANTIPGMTTSSLVPKAAAAHGWAFGDLVKRIISISISKWER